MAKYKSNRKVIEMKLQEAITKGLVVGAELILTEAKELCPQDTGTLRRSGTVTVEDLPSAAAVYEKVKK